MIRIERRLETPRLLVVTVPLVAIGCAFLAAGVVLLATGRDPVFTFTRMVDRAFVAEGALTATLVTATPLLLTGLAAAVAFRMRVWNIGGEGQLYLGALAAAGAGIALDGQAAGVLIPAMVAAGLLAGAAWAAIPGLLRAYLSTNEIIVSLMLNYLAGLILTYVIFSSRSPWRDVSSPGAAFFPQGRQLSPAASWPYFPLTVDLGMVALLVVALSGLAVAVLRRRRGRPRVTPLGLAAWVAALAVASAWTLLAGAVRVAPPLGFLLGLVAAAGVWFLYAATRFGFEVRVIGDSTRAARYAGMRTRRKIVAVMGLSGAIAGLGGASQIGDFRHLLDPRGIQQPGFGYAGIVVAALARYNPLAVVLVAVLLGGLSNAGYSLQGPDFPAGLVGMLQGLILFFALGAELLVRYRIRLRRRGDAAPRRPGAVAAARRGVRA